MVVSLQLMMSISLHDVGLVLVLPKEWLVVAMSACSCQTVMLKVQQMDPCLRLIDSVKILSAVAMMMKVEMHTRQE